MIFDISRLHTENLFYPTSHTADKMSWQGNEYYDQYDSQATFDLESFGDLMGNVGNEFDGVDFSYPPPEQFEFGANQPSADNAANFDLTGDVSGVTESNIDPVLRGCSAQHDTMSQAVLNAPEFGMNLQSGEDPALFDAAGGIPDVIDPSLLLGTSAQLNCMDHSTAERPATMMPNSQVNPALASQPPNYAFGAYDHNDRHAIPAWNPRPFVPSFSTYPPPPPPAPIMVTRSHKSPLMKRKQDSRRTPYQSNKRRPTIPESFVPYIDVASPPRRESEVHDAKGSKDTTIANDYYFRIHSLPPLNDFFGKGSHIRYQGPEFHHKVEFTGADFIKYLRTCPRKPVLIVQLQPPKCNHRYIRGGQSFKCRNKNCPDPKKTIWKGHFRVCITEFYDSEGHWINPFQSAAGYLHLYCLEQMVNLSEVVADMPVAVCPEVRDFKHEPNNPMQLSKLEQRSYWKWMDEFAPTWADLRDQCTKAGIPRHQWPVHDIADEDRLYRRLMAAHLQKNAATIRMAEKRRAKAGSNKITSHADQLLGDVGKHVAAMKRRRDVLVVDMKNDEDQVATGQRSSDRELSGKRRRLSFRTTAKQQHYPDPGLSSKRQRFNSQFHHPYNLRSVSPGQSRLKNLLSQAQLMPSTLTPSLIPQPLQFDKGLFPDFGNMVPEVFDDAQLDAFFGMSGANFFPAPLAQEVPGNSVVEQSIVVNTSSAVPVPALASPPWRSRGASDNSLVRKSPRGQKSPLTQKSPLA